MFLPVLTPVWQPALTPGDATALAVRVGVPTCWIGSPSGLEPSYGGVEHPKTARPACGESERTLHGSTLLRSAPVEALLAFGAALLAFRLAGSLARRWRAAGAPQLAAWSASLLAYALASAALAWGAAAGWNEASFRVYYTCGGLLTAALLGVGSLLFVGRRWAAPVGLLYTGLAIGIGFASPLTSPVSGTTIPAAQEHFDLFPERVLAIAANSLGTIAVVGVALLTIRRRPLGNTLIVAGVVAAATGSAVAGLGVAQTTAFIALGVVLLYVGMTTQRKNFVSFRVSRKHPG